MREPPPAMDASGTAPERHVLRLVSTVWQRPLARRMRHLKMGSDQDVCDKGEARAERWAPATEASTLPN